MADFPNDQEGFDRCWSNTAGELAGYRASIAEIEKRAGMEFVRRRDDVANGLRDLAVFLKGEADKVEKRLNEFIAESKRRAYEMRKAYGQ